MSDSHTTARIRKPKTMDEIDARIVCYLALCNMNIKAVSRKIYLSETAVAFRMDKIRKITGLNPRNFFELGELYTIALEILGDEYELL